MAKTLVKDNTGRTRIEDIADRVAKEEAKKVNTNKNEELDFTEKGKIRKEAYEAMLYGGSNFNDHDR
ncbi:MAG: hypothetical protein IJ870_01670 [Alphaproteobacteria bacterium]|nr:hypothetical protein [Alphaproteobacteria bacterium]